MELMRGLAFVALLFAGSAVGAELRQAEVCGDGTTHQAGYCPAVLSSASCSATGATTGSCSATSDEADGTRYVCATSSATALTGAQIEACSGGTTVAGASAAETGSNSVSLSGLTTDAAHYGQIVNESPEGWYSNRLVSSSFTPTDSGGDPYNLYATDTESRGTIPFTVTWPTEPVQSTTVAATTLGELQAAVNAGARKIEYSGVSSGSLTMNDDVWIEMADGSSIGSVTWQNGTVRTKISAANTARSPSIGSIVVGSLSTDIMLQNITIAASSVDVYDTRRIAFVGADISVSGAYFGVWAGGLVATHNNQDVIIANSRVDANGGCCASFRLQHIDRLVIVDTLGDTRDTGYATLRLEFNTNNAWVRNFTGFGGGFTLDPQVGSSRPTATVHDVTYYDSNVYHTNLISITDTQGDLSDPSKVYNITMDDVLFHSDLYTPGNTIGGVQGSWTVGIAQYADFVSYPAWSFQ